MTVLQERPPEGLLPWIQKQKDIKWKDYLIYKAGWRTEPLTGLKEKCTDAVCTACQQTMKLERAYGVRHPNGGCATFGVGYYIGSEWCALGSGETGFCPECGAGITVLHSSAANKLDRYIWPMTLEKQDKNLILYSWRVQRHIDKTGSVTWNASPWEAYEFREKKALLHKHWHTGVFGNGAVIDSYWSTLSRFSDRMYDTDIVYSPGGIAKATAGTWMENSKLEIYMKVTDEYRFPVSWLKIYQRRHKAETLMTCGAAKLVAGIIAREKRATNHYYSFTSKVDLLKELDWRGRRPYDILRITKAELPYFVERQKKDAVDRLMLIQHARKEGFTIKPGQESGESLDSQMKLLKAGILPAKAAAYLDRQQKKYPGRYHTITTLFDYWNMAKPFGLDLTDPAVLWPQNLAGAHDQLVERKKVEKYKHLDEQFATRYKRMSRYSWERDGILIRPAKNTAELIKEGEQLHHCVATYSERHAKGDLTIFLIRRAEEPDKPWYTLNFNEKTLSVTENRGLRNCARTEEIRAFEAAWLDWVRAGCKRKKEEKAA